MQACTRGQEVPGCRPAWADAAGSAAATPVSPSGPIRLRGPQLPGHGVAEVTLLWTVFAACSSYSVTSGGESSSSSTSIVLPGGNGDDALTRSSAVT